MEPLHSTLWSASPVEQSTSHRFIFEEQREVRQWYLENQYQIDEIRNDATYFFKGVFVQTEPRRVPESDRDGLISWKKIKQEASGEEGDEENADRAVHSNRRRKNTPTKPIDAKGKSKRKAVKEMTLEEMRRQIGAGTSATDPPHNSSDDDNDSEKKDEDAIEASMTLEPLRFRGLHTRRLYDLHGAWKPRYRKLTGDVFRLTPEQIDNAVSDSEDDEEPYYQPTFEINDKEIEEEDAETTWDIPHEELNRLKFIKGQKKRLTKNFNDPTIFKNVSSFSQTYFLFRRKMSGMDAFPRHLKVGKVRRESPRVQLLMQSLSPSTLQFLSKNRSSGAFSSSLTSPKNPRLDQEDDVFVNFHSYNSLRDKWEKSENETATAKHMVTNILYRSILEKKYELARRALGIYIRQEDSDMRPIYSMALRILEHRKKERERESGNSAFSESNQLPSSLNNLQDIGEDEELIRWMIVAYPAMIEYFSSRRNQPKNVEYTQLHVLKMLHKPAPIGYSEALDYLDDLVRKAPYLGEPVFFLLRASANTQLAFDKGADINLRLRAIDRVHDDYRVVQKLGGENFYPDKLVDVQLEQLNILQELLRDGKDYDEKNSDESSSGSSGEEDEEQADASETPNTDESSSNSEGSSPSPAPGTAPESPSSSSSSEPDSD